MTISYNPNNQRTVSYDRTKTYPALLIDLETSSSSPDAWERIVRDWVEKRLTVELISSRAGIGTFELMGCAEDDCTGDLLIIARIENEETTGEPVLINSSDLISLRLL